MKIGTNYYWYHNDHLGTPQKLTTTSGAVVWSARYTSFLEANIDALSTIINNLRAPGQYFDGESGLHYNRLRYYDAETGRYLNTDPIGFEGGDENLYVYVLNDPINWFDPYGMARKGNKGDGSASGKNTSNPYKHCKQHPTKPDMLICKDKKTGKKRRYLNHQDGVKRKKCVVNVKAFVQNTE